MTPDTDYYRILGVDVEASTREIKQAYRRLVRRYHPDRDSRPHAQERFREVTEAYAVLVDPETRAEYDQRIGLARRHRVWHGGFHLDLNLGIARVSVGVGPGDEVLPDEE